MSETGNKAAKKVRLDRLCVQLDLAPSRQRAQALIMAGHVLVDDQPATKAGTPVSPGAQVRLRQPDHPFVSRGGLKLQAALEFLALDVAGAAALDVGASTGGFTDCLLQRGARHVLAVDVGYGQLAWKLRQDPRVTCVERCNARKLDPDELRQVLDGTGAWPLDLAVVDVSFISLKLVLPAVSRVLGPDKPIVALIKPQFEAGRQDVGKGGVVRDPETREQAIRGVLQWAAAQGYSIGPGLDSPLAGPKGNVEYLSQLFTPGLPAGP